MCIYLQKPFIRFEVAPKLDTAKRFDMAPSVLARTISVPSMHPYNERRALLRDPTPWHFNENFTTSNDSYGSLDRTKWTLGSHRSRRSSGLQWFQNVSNEIKWGKKCWIKCKESGRGLLICCSPVCRIAGNSAVMLDDFCSIVPSADY